MNKKYRFFFHYFKSKKKMSVHFRDKCVIVDDVKCNCPAETKWRKTQPNLILQGFCKNVEIENNVAVIS